MAGDDWQGALDMFDMQERKDAVKFWEKEKARLLADLEREDDDNRDGRPSFPPPKQPKSFRLFRWLKQDQDRGDDR